MCKLMVAGVNGASGVSVLRQSVGYKQGLENVLIQSQHMVERNAMEPGHLCGSVVTCPAAIKVQKDKSRHFNNSIRFIFY